MKYYIQKYMDAIQDKTSDIHPVYKQNFRELIKLIPVIGSWIDANTMGAIENSLLEDRLDNLDNACRKAVSTENFDSLKNEIFNINNMLLVIFLTNLDSIRKENESISNNVKLLLSIAKKDQDIFVANPKFKFVTISGASATGKDCMLDLISSRKKLSNTPMDLLTKFTTRKKRIVDSKYYDFISEEEFDLLEESGNIIFPYFKHGARYGFDSNHLMQSAQKEMILFCVFTHFESLPSDRQFLKHQKIEHLSVLLTADFDSLILRSESRMLDSSDRDRRIKSIKKDIDYINKNDKYIDKYYDLIIDNGDRYSKHNTHNEIVCAAKLKELELEIVANRVAGGL